MAQYVGVQIMDEQFSVIIDTDIDANYLVLAAYEFLDWENYPLLFSIDDYANTIFNERQSKRLKVELEMLASDERFGIVQEIIEELRALIEKVGIHQYLCFVGD